jgi:hypothetical protein
MEKITIHLTDSRPVSITKDLWPVAARGDGVSRRCYHTPIPAYEVDQYRLRVRQHADGRVIVYGWIDASPAWTGTEDTYAGEMLGTANAPVTNANELTADKIIAAIRRVGEDAGLPASVIRECIADLPSEEIDEGTADEGTAVATEGTAKLATLLALLVQAQAHVPSGLAAEIRATLAR